MNAQLQPSLTIEPRSSLVSVAHVVYALHAVSLCIGAWTAATVVGSFLFGWPSLIGVVLNYAFNSEARGTWLEAHYRWQIRTFWLALLWSAALALVTWPLMLVLVGFALWPLGLFVLGIWAGIRVLRGWLRLRDGRPVG
jgi:uncharacterized membrane protein